MPGLAPLSMGPDIAGGIGAGLENVEPEQLQLEQQKQQVAAGKMQLAAAQNAQKQQALGQMDSQAAFLARMGRANPGGETNPQIAQQLDMWAQKRGLPSPVQRDQMGGFKIDFDMVPGSGGINDMKPDDKARAMALPEEERRIEYPGQSEAFYKAKQYISDPKEQDSMRAQWAKQVSQLGDGHTTPGMVANWLMTTPGMSSVVSVPDAVAYLTDPAQMRTVLGPAAQAKIQQISNIGLSDKAKANYYRIMTEIAPKRAAEQIQHMQNQDSTAKAGLGIKQQIANADTKRADGYATNVENQAGLISARIKELSAQSDRTRQLIEKGNSPLASAAVTALGKQSTTVATMLNAAVRQLDQLNQVTSPTDDQITKIGQLNDEISGLTSQLQGIQSDQQTFATAIENQVKSKLSKGAGMPATFKPTNQGPQFKKGQPVPSNPDYTFTGEKQGNIWVIVDKDGKRKGYNP